MEIELAVAVAPHSLVPTKTRWFILASEHYPLGAIDFLPSAIGGLESTHQHQNNNSLVGLTEKSWRPGKLCLDFDTASLNRHETFPEEPYGADARLVWHCRRAIDWLEHASGDLLVKDGDPFELPDYRPSEARRFLFQESPSEHVMWQASKANSGTATLAVLDDQTRVIRDFADGKGTSIHQPTWGTAIAELKHTELAIWVRTDQLIVLPPWQAPMTWGDLCSWFDQHQIDLMRIVGHLSSSIRDGKSHLLLFGAPIPSTYGGPPEHFHWTAIQLPVLAQPGRRNKGYRDNPKSLAERDRSHHFRENAPVVWVESINAHTNDLTSRGALPQKWTDAKILLIGAGSLGSAIAELLVRAGVRDLTVCDCDTFEAGNLARHTLTLADVGESKALALRRRLHNVSPHSTVHAIAQRFPPLKGSDDAHIAGVDIIIDCSANNDVLFHLESTEFDRRPIAFSLSFGRDVKRLFVHGSRTGPIATTAFFSWIEPWLNLERNEGSADAPLRPTTGCWHPAFPGRADHVWLFASQAVAWMDAYVESAEVDDHVVFLRSATQGVARDEIPGG